MATSETTTQPFNQQVVTPPLEAGDHLDQPTFHARYEAMPPDVKAELIAGVVYMPAALRMPHGRFRALLMMWLGDYWTETPGVDAAGNATVVLGDDSEPQPDACLRIIGGQTHEDENEYLIGAPELVAEVASSSESYDLHAKRADYERLGVQEYLVLVIRQERAVWYRRGSAGFEEMAPDKDGILRSRIFPGLWLDPAALFGLNGQRVQEVLRLGLATDEHVEFVKRLKTS